MTFNELTASNIRSAIKNTPGFSERNMFGGISFILKGNMCCGVIEDRLVVRVGPAAYEAALQEPHARPMDFTGRPLSGFVYVEPAGYESPRALQTWINRGLEFVLTLPSK